MLTVNTDADRIEALEARVAALEALVAGKPSPPSSSGKASTDRAAYMRDYMRRRRGK